jgi:hypothetical protein
MREAARYNPALMNGDCRLCLASGVELRDSHIMPKFSYRKARASGAAGDPVHIRGGKAFQTSEQRKEPLLCGLCEQRLAQVEGRIATLLPHAEADASTARLLGLVGLVQDVSGGYRRVPLGSVSKQDLAYFAASLFWRASVSSLYNMSLDAGVAEALRRYLLGQAAFPAELALVAIYYDLPFQDTHDMSSTCFEPQSSTDGPNARAYRALVNGLLFHLEAGPSIEDVFLQSCVVRTNSMFLGRQEGLVEMFADRMLNAHVVDNLRRRFERRQAND